MISVRKVKKYCKEDISKIENYDKAIADKTQTWVCHHRTEIWWNCSREDLIENECYYGRKACELIFLTPSEHKSLHGANQNEATRKKISDALKGNTNCKGRKLSDEHRKKLSDANKGQTGYWTGKKRGPMSDDARKKLSESMKGNTNCKGRKLSEETKRKISMARKKMKEALK